jgi:hypothetical protein
MLGSAPQPQRLTPKSTAEMNSTSPPKVKEHRAGAERGGLGRQAESGRPHAILRLSLVLLQPAHLAHSGGRSGHALDVLFAGLSVVGRVPVPPTA